MISRIHGTLESVEQGRAQVALESGLTYELLVPAFTAAQIAGRLGQHVTLHTLHFIEGSAQTGNLVPRLAGFLTPSDKAFFELFTSVKGIGPRKGLRAMSLDSAQIANAIADRDVKLLQSMPEIGRRLAETIVATLHGKVDAFVSEAAYGSSGATDEHAAPGAAAPSGRPARDALEILLQLGENRAQALQSIDEVLTRNPDLDDPQQIITEVFAARTGV